MQGTDDRTYYLERAKMHDTLADATNDGPARKVHQAMAAEYRRRAAALSDRHAPPRPRLTEMAVAAS